MKSLIYVLGGMLLCVPTYATTAYVFQSGSGSTELNVEADLTFGTNTLTLTLTNNIVDQISDGQNLNGIFFTIPGTTFTANEVTDSTFSSVDRSKISKSTANGWTDTATSTDPWNLSNTITATTGTFHFTALGNVAGATTIIGAPNVDTYDNVNSSITNQVHDPFLDQTATWVLNIPGVTAADESLITNFIFGFGTDNSVTDPGTLCTDCGGGTTQDLPEPYSFVLMGSGLVLLGLAQYRRRLNRS